MSSFKHLDPDRIEAGLGKSRKLVFFRSTASSNDIAWEYANSADSDGLAVFTEQQTDGRGRRSRRWHSSLGQSLLCSTILCESDLQHETITLCVAVALSEAIRKVSGLLGWIKWPNDIFVNNKKIAGVLVESKRINGKLKYVIGFGVNCHQDACFFVEKGISNIATSIDAENCGCCDRNQLAVQSLDLIDYWLETAGKSPEQLVSRWRQLSNQLGQRVELEFNNKRFAGQCINIDPARGIVLQLEGGGVRMFDAAHTTIIKNG